LPGLPRVRWLGRRLGRAYRLDASNSAARPLPIDKAPPEVVAPNLC